MCFKISFSPHHGDPKQSVSLMTIRSPQGSITSRLTG